MRYKRVLIKLSGGAVAGNAEFGFEPERLNYIANEIISVVRLGVEVSLVIGGGIYFAAIWQKAGESKGRKQTTSAHLQPSLIV